MNENNDRRGGRARRRQVAWYLGAAGPVFAALDCGDAAPPWQDFAACAETDPEIFFPEKGASTKEAKLVCRACPVRAECLEYALQAGDRFGVYGGLSPQERRRLGRSAPAVAVVTEKTCTGCRITKPLGEFHRNPHNSTGHAERCKACRHLVSKRRWQEKAA